MFETYNTKPIKYVGLLLFISIFTTSQLFSQDAKTVYQSARTAFENGNAAQCISLLNSCQNALGGSNAKIESLKCQALMMNDDWINAAIAYANYDRLLPGSARNGEGYSAMLEYKIQIWNQLEEIEKKKKEEKEKEIKDDLAAANREAAQQESTQAAKMKRINDNNEKQLYQLGMQSKDKTLLELYKKEIGSSGKNLEKVTSEIDKQNNPAAYLTDAIKADNIEELKYLFGLGASFKWTNTKGESLLQLAIVHDAYKIFNQLVQMKADMEQVDLSGNTPLIKAIIKKKPEFVNLLLRNGANPSAKNTTSLQSPLYYALINSYTNIGEALLKKGVDPNEAIYSTGSATPLYIVADKTQSQQFATCLLDNGAKINALSGNGYTPLIAAVNKGDKDFVNFLLNNGAEINLKGTDKRTALHWAVQHRDVEMVKYLIERAGAGKKAADASGKTPLQLAKKLDDKALVNTIKNSKSFVKLSSVYSVREKQYLTEVAKRAELLQKRNGRENRFFFAYTYDTTCKYGLSIGTINNKGIGVYFTARANSEAFTSGGSNGTVDNKGKVTGGQYTKWGNDWRFKNEIKTGTAEALLGITKKIAYPLWVYAGAGVSYNTVFWKMDIHDNLGDFYKSGWVKNSEAAKLKPVFEAGLIVDLKGFNMRGGVKTQTGKDISITVGVGFSLVKR